MRIVLTNAGKKEIILDESEKNNSNRIINHSEEKVKYSPKIYIPSDRKKHNTKKGLSLNNKKDIIPPYINTEANIKPINNDKQLKKSLTNKVNDSFEFNQDNRNNLKFINIKTSKKLVSKELNDMYSIKSKQEQMFDIQDINNNNLSNDFSLPLIQKSLPLRDILLDRNAKNINKITLNKQINKNENNLINYLKLNKTIKPSFIEKLNKADNDRLVKLDKLCQKYFNDKKRNDILRKNIQDKIKLEYSNDSKYCRENLITLKRSIQSYKNIYKSYFSSVIYLII